MTQETENLTAKMEPVIEMIPTSLDRGVFGARSEAQIIKDINVVLDTVGIPELITGITYAEEDPKVSLNFMLPEDQNTGSNSYLEEFFDIHSDCACYLFNPNIFDEIEESDYFVAVATTMNVLYRHQASGDDSVAAFEKLFMLNSEMNEKVLPIAENCVAAWNGIMALYALRNDTDLETFNSIVPEIFELESITLY